MVQFSSCSMKRLEVFLLSLDGMLVHRGSLPLNFVRFPPTIRRYPFIHLDGERQCESKVSYLRTQHNVHVVVLDVHHLPKNSGNFGAEDPIGNHEILPEVLLF